MSDRDKFSPLHPSVLIILGLAVCVCSLAVHFIAEGLLPIDGQFMFDLTAQGGNVHPVHEHGDDQFVLSSLNCVQVVCFLTRSVSQAPAHTSSVLIPPLLPPPNL